MIGRRNFSTRYPNAESSPVPASSITSASLISLIGRDATRATGELGVPFLPDTVPATPRYPSGLRAIVPIPRLTPSGGGSCAESEGGKPLDSWDFGRIGSSGKGMLSSARGDTVRLDAAARREGS